MKLGLTLALITCLSASFGCIAGNDRHDDRNQPRNQGAKNEQRRLAVNSPDQAQRQFQGKVLSVQSSGSGYRIKILNNDGQVFSVSVDAATGRVSRN